MPDEPEVHGLLALTLVNDARRDARFADGAVVLLRDQDRSLWDFDQIAEGRASLERIDGARDAYDRALELVHSDAERCFLERRLAEL
jgi:predicted RNA polymerase sigma factor